MIIGVVKSELPVNNQDIRGITIVKYIISAIIIDTHNNGISITNDITALVRGKYIIFQTF